jgi:DNA-binding CsgD family transcriptional regulator
LAFLAGGTCWGACGIYRQRDRGDFAPDEARLLGRVGRHLADGYRRALMLAAATHRGSASPPGLILFDGRCGLEFVDPTARAYLDSVVDRIPRPQLPDRVPMVVRAVAECTRQHGEARMPARARVRTRDGRWLVFYGTRLPDSQSEQLAVLVEPAGPAELWPMIADAYQLSPRERQITLLCLRGRSTTEMGRELHLSPYTVQDHLKLIFDKVGVHTRRALVAKVFLDCYWHPILASEAPGHRGGFSGAGRAG